MSAPRIVAAGLTLIGAPPARNGIISNRATNPITVRVANQGLDAHTFNVVARFNGGQTAPTPVTLAGVEDVKNHTRDVAIDLGPMPGLKGKETQVEFVITNDKGANVFAQRPCRLLRSPRRARLSRLSSGPRRHRLSPK